MIQLAHKVELDPTVAQKVYFARACGTARFAWNWALNEWQRQYKAGEKPSEAALRRQLNATKAETYPWMSEVGKVAPQQAIKNLGTAYKRFFKGIAKYPKPKKKGRHDSFRADNGPANSEAQAVKVVGYEVALPRVERIKMKEQLRLNGRVVSCVVSRIADKWFASFTVEIKHVVPNRENQAAAVGVDLGVKQLATLSDGTVFENPKPLRSNLAKLKRLQRSLSRKTKGSSNRQKAKMKVAKLHYRIKCIRQDTLHKLTTYLTKHFTTIGIESLNVSGMLRNHCLAQAIADCGFYEFKRQLAYKASLYGAQVITADRWYPSSKKCSECGWIKPELSLSEREWSCQECGCVHDRDMNAAKNLRLMAESSSVIACGEDIRPNLLVGQASTKQEPGNSYAI